MPPPASSSSPAAEPADPVSIEGAVLDAPGPLRAGARPPAAPNTEPGADVLGAAPAEEERETSALQALKARLEGLLGTNGHTQDDDPDAEPAVRRPLRTASAARARAEATVAARRSPGEVWGMRVLALVVVAVLLTAFVLILAYIA